MRIVESAFLTWTKMTAPRPSTVQWTPCPQASRLTTTHIPHTPHSNNGYRASSQFCSTSLTCKPPTKRIINTILGKSERSQPSNHLFLYFLVFLWLRPLFSAHFLRHLLRSLPDDLTILWYLSRYRLCTITASPWSSPRADFPSTTTSTTYGTHLELG